MRAMFSSGATQIVQVATSVWLLLKVSNTSLDLSHSYRLVYEFSSHTTLGIKHKADKGSHRDCGRHEVDAA